MVVEVISQVVSHALRDDLRKIPVAVAGDTAEGAGTEDDAGCDNQGGGAPGIEHGVDTIAQHFRNNQAKDGTGRKTQEGHYPHCPVFLEKTH